MPFGEPLFDPAERILILTPNANAHRKDFTGAFKPESETLHKAYGAASTTIERIPVGRIDPKTLSVISDQQTFEDSAKAVIAKIADGTPWTRVIMMCHGWSSGLQLGFRTRKRKRNDEANWNALIAALKLPSLKTLTLFACSAGKNPQEAKSGPGTGESSLADLIRDQSGVAVIAHSTPGHATRNPDLIVFERSASPVLGGITPCARGTLAYKNSIRLLTLNKRNGAGKLLGNVVPQGHSRLAFASIPLCQSASELHALLSATPG